MKFKFSLICVLALSLSYCTAYAQTDASLYFLAKHKLYNQLSDSLLTSKSKYTNLYNGILKSVFSQPIASNKILNTINPNTLADSLQFLYRVAMYDNYLNLFYYKKAALLGDTLIKRYRKFYISNNYDDLVQDVNIWNAIAHVKPEVVTKSGDSQVAIKQDAFGLKNVPVTVSSTGTFDFVFDTGAGLSVVTESFAKQVGIKIISDRPIKTRAMAGNYVPGKMGMTDQLTIGNITVKNVVFFVFPDSVLTFANGALKINAILGFPVIKEFGTFTQTKTGITVPASIPLLTNAHHNFIIQNQVSIIYMNVFNKQLPFVFDTGDNDLSLNKIFYDTFKNQLKGETKMGMLAGAGASAKYKAFVIDSLTLRVNEQPATFKKLSVNMDSYSINGDEYYGNIGQGLISKFRTMTISFTNAQIDFK